MSVHPLVSELLTGLGLGLGSHDTHVTSTMGTFIRFSLFHSLWSESECSQPKVHSLEELALLFPSVKKPDLTSLYMFDLVFAEVVLELI